MTEFEEKVIALLGIIASTMAAKLPHIEQVILRDRVKQIIDPEND